METWERTFEIKKLDEPQRLVFGVLSKIVNEDGTPVVDSQGDIIPLDELEKAAYEYVQSSRQADVMHDGVSAGELVESFVSTPEKRAAQGVAKSNDRSVYWWVGYRVTPQAFAKVQAGELREFSIGGTAVREPVAA